MLLINVAPPYFNRISKDRIKEIAPLAAMAYDGQLQFTIGRRNLSQFYYKTLPWMRSIADVDESKLGEIQPLLPPKAHFPSIWTQKKTGSAVKQKFPMVSSSQLHWIKRELSEILPETFRDPDREFDAAQTVLSYFPFTEANGRYHSEKDESSIFEILTEGIDRFLSLGDVHTTDRFRRITIRKTPRLSVGFLVMAYWTCLFQQKAFQRRLLEILKSYQKKEEILPPEKWGFSEIRRGR